jgi:phosphatidylinositol-3-phosphatase
MRVSAILLVLAACSSHHDGNGNGNPDAPVNMQHDAPRGSGSADAPQQGSGTPTIFSIILENQDYAEIVGSSNAPYINSLIALGGLATNYMDTGHPSTPNYLNMISGNNQYPGIIDVLPTQVPYFPSAAMNLATQLEAADIKWRSYGESEGSAGCLLTNVGEFVPRHDPFLYFTDQQKGANNLCADTNVDYSNFAGDLATDTYKYMFIAPNLIDDGHDPTTAPVTGLMDADAWLKTNVPAILASEGYKSGGVLFITWDEAEGRNGDNADQIPMIILSPRIKQAGITSATAYTHSSFLATVEDLLSLPRLSTVTTTASMEADFLN